MNREIYRRARESSVRGAYGRLEEILATRTGALVAIIAPGAPGGLRASWLISRSLARPVRELTEAMAVVGAGDLDHPIRRDLARRDRRPRPRAREHDPASSADSRAQLVQAEKLASIGEMSAAVAHGLRNPLASLRAAAQLVRRHPDVPLRHRAPRRHHRGGGPARPAHQPPAELQPARALSSVPESLPRLIDGSPAGRRRADPGAPRRPRDGRAREPAAGAGGSHAARAGHPRDRVQRARRHARRADGSASARSCPTATDRAWWCEVTDTGAGIPEQVLPSVCEPFFTTRQEGTGLGLAIAKRYVEQNGGRLEIVSRPGEGTTVRLPASGGAHGMSGSTVLIVDDERTLARAIKAFLTESGYEAEVAGDAEQALRLLETLRPDVVFSDVRLPGHERHRAAAADPGVRPRDPRRHHDRPRHHRRRGRGGQAGRVRLPEEAGGSRGAEAPGRPRPRDTPSSGRSCPTTAAARPRARPRWPACSGDPRPSARCSTRPARSRRSTRRRRCSSPARPAPARAWLRAPSTAPSPRAGKPFIEVNCTALPGHAHGGGAVRPRARRVHRREGIAGWACSRPPRAGSSSSMRWATSSCAAGEAAQGGGGANRAAGRRDPRPPDRCPDPGRHQPRSRARRPARPVPPRPLFPAGSDHPPPAAAPGARGRHPAAGPALPRAVQRQVREGRCARSTPARAS